MASNPQIWYTYAVLKITFGFMMAFDTPLRYPGGKGRLSSFVREVVDLNGLRGGEYIELYAGGAGIAMTLLLNNIVSRVHINDLNRSIYSFWRMVLDSSDVLCQRISDTDITIDEWYRQREVQLNPDSELLDLAFSTFFLNRTNRSGIIAAGVIGGKNQAGQWKLDARFNKANLIDRIRKIASVSSRISLHNCDAADFIQHQLPNITDKALLYLDPPYYVKGKGLYQNHYEHADHATIADLVGVIKQKWLVTYDNVDHIKTLYSDYPQRDFGLQYSAQGRYYGTEVLITKADLILPLTVQPTRAALSEFTLTSSHNKLQESSVSI